MSVSAHAEAFAPPVPAAGERTNLCGLSRAELKAEVTALGLPSFRANQLWKWMYARGVTDFEAMTDLSRDLRARLTAHYTLERPEVITHQQSQDGTQKWLLRMAGGHAIETVFIPEEDRGTLCVSSQVGCTLTCRFCHTGTQPLVRNLGAREILAQILFARDALNDWPPTQSQDRKLSNIVMMGMGEPLYNYDNMAKALTIAMDGDGVAISKRRITLSTAGVVPMIDRCGEELEVNLAVSLHAVTDELRDQIVPLNRKYPIKDLLRACKDYPTLSNARRITFEYVMLKDVNDSDADARALLRLLKDIPSKVNLIPFNPWPGAPFECSSAARIKRFGDILSDGGLSTPVRKPRGQDILAACGQLRSASQRARRTA